MVQADGILPNEVIRDAASSGEIIYLTLADGIEIGALEGIVKNVYAALDIACAGEQPPLSACVAWGRRLFDRLPSKPADLTVATPPGATLLDSDLAIYVMAREEAKLAELKRQLCAACAGQLTAVASQHGFQRRDGRELGGFLDGLRNARKDRERVVFVDRDETPEEPEAADGGSYMVTMRILQNLDTWAAVDQPRQERIIGRRKSDGSRLDLPEGTAVDEEGEIAGGGALPLDAHIAKAGPRGVARDQVRIFRRGLPFTELTPDGHCETGLLFVSFQASMEQFRTISDEWMGNIDFPDPNTNTDALFRDGHATVTTVGCFFVPAHQVDYPGAQFFHPIADDDRCLGHIVIRKTLQDAQGAPIRGERGGFTFQLIGPDAQSVGEPFTTSSAGRAISPSVPRDVTYALHETTARNGFDLVPDQPVLIDRRRVMVHVVNKLTPQNPNPGYR
jgi:Dyp-type peroxidase family